MLKVFEAFSGIGAQRMALYNLGVKHEVVAISEIDKFAIKSYEAIWGKTPNLGDISKLKAEDIPDHDLFTYSFPCTDLSVAGRRKGMEKGSGTASSLLYECERVIHNKKPKYLLLENVKNLVGKKFKTYFDDWLSWLEDEGYTNYWQVLNAKDYGVPQNRERVFVVSVLGEDIGYTFPEKVSLQTKLKDVLEKDVEDKYYLSQELQDRFVENKNFRNAIKTLGTTKGEENTRTGQRDVVYSDEGVMGTLTSTDYKQPKQIGVVGKISGWSNDQLSRVYSEEGVSPSLNTMQGGNRQPKIAQLDDSESKDRDVFSVIGSTQKNAAVTDGSYTPTLTSAMGQGGGHVPMPVIGASRGRNPRNSSDRTVGAPTKQVLELNKQGTSNTVTSVQKDNYVVNPNFTIRKLTPEECWRLMGFPDWAFKKAQEVNSNTQLYKQAGNSIVVPVLESIFKKLFVEK